LQGQALPAIRIEAQSGVYDYAAKYETGDTLYHIPCGLSVEQERELQALALTANHALGCSGWSRVDLIQGPEGFVLLEVNTVPGMSATSLVPKAAAATGLDFPALCEKILETAHG
jgi:D-alanine-D-alanine ligase